MIEESHIEKYLQNLEEDITDDLFLKEEELLEYLKSDTFSSLSLAEREMLLFCFEVIFHSYRSAKNQSPEFDLDAYLDAEEENWHIREEHNNWTSTVDSLFKNYKEEDLLAFVEDTLVDDEEEDNISEIAKEIIFISSKSYIDSIT